MSQNEVKNNKFQDLLKHKGGINGAFFSEIAESLDDRSLWIALDVHLQAVEKRLKQLEEATQPPPPAPINILPNFSDKKWYKSSSVTITSAQGYDIAFTSSKSWSGMSVYGWTDVKGGDTVTVGVQETNENARVQLWSDGTEILAFPSGTLARETTITIPEGTEVVDFNIAARSVRQVITKGIYVYKVTFKKEGK